MYKDGWLTYNQDDLNFAILEAEKVSSTASSFGTKVFKIRGLIPSNFLASNLTDAMSKLLAYDLFEIEVFLKKAQKALSQYVNDNAMSNELIKAGYRIEEINGIRGYLYIPEGYTSTTGLPLVTWLAGSSEVYEYSMNEKGLSRMLNEGYKLDAVVWCPISHWAYARYQDTSELCGAINKIIDTYKLDKDRNALIGYSVGARVGFWCVEENPNFFSTVVTYGDIGGHTTKVSPDTTFIMYQADIDHTNEAATTYKTLKENGNQVMFYELDDASHTDVDLIFTDKLMSDIINIKKGDKFSNIVDDVINVETKYINGTRLLVDDNHYIPLQKINGDSSNHNSDEI